jgi:hypothetical protein
MARFGCYLPLAHYWEAEMTYTVQLFEVDQAYGGPEEGGWWFTYGQPVSDSAVGFKVTRRFKTEAKAWGYARRIQPRLKRIEGNYAAYICPAKPKVFPATRPFYD